MCVCVKSYHILSFSTHTHTHRYCIYDTACSTIVQVFIFATRYVFNIIRNTIKQIYEHLCYCCCVSSLSCATSYPYHLLHVHTHKIIHMYKSYTTFCFTIFIIEIHIEQLKFYIRERDIRYMIHSTKVNQMFYENYIYWFLILDQ